MDKNYLPIAYKKIGIFNKNDEIGNCNYDDLMLNYFTCFLIYFSDTGFPSFNR